MEAEKAAPKPERLIFIITKYQGGSRKEPPFSICVTRENAIYIQALYFILKCNNKNNIHNKKEQGYNAAYKRLFVF